MKIPTEVRLCWDFFLGGAVVSTAPTAQALHQPSKCCTIYFVEGVSKLKYLAN